MFDDERYGAVMDRTESDAEPVRGLEVRVETQEQRRHYGRPTIGEPRTQHRFYVVDRDGGYVLHNGRWTTPHDTHVTFEEAQARAYAYRRGLLDAVEETMVDE